MQKALDSQGLSVQEGQGLHHCSGQEALRLKAKGFRWPDQARLQKEGQDHQEGYPQAWVQHLQDPQMQGYRPLQIIRAWKERKHQGSSTFLREQIQTNWLIAAHDTPALRREESSSLVNTISHSTDLPVSAVAQHLDWKQDFRALKLFLCAVT